MQGTLEALIGIGFMIGPALAGILYDVCEIIEFFRNLPNFPNISAKLKKVRDAKWSPISVLPKLMIDLTIPSHSLHFWIMVVLCKC